MRPCQGSSGRGEGGADRIERGELSWTISHTHTHTPIYFHTCTLNIWAFCKGGGDSGPNDAKSALFPPLVDFRHFVGSIIIEKSPPPYLGCGEFKNQGFGLI